MADKVDQIKARVEFYESKMEGYKALLKLLKGKMTPKLEEATNRINEAFTLKIYTEARAIGRRQELLQQVWDEQRIDVMKFVDAGTDIERQMSTLDTQYTTHVELWMDDLKKEVDSALENESITVEVAEKASIIFEQLKIQDYYTKSHTIIIGINEYKHENKLRNAVNDAMAIRNKLVEDLEFEKPNQLFDEKATRHNIRKILEKTCVQP